MKVLIASVFAIALLGTAAANAATIGLGIHIGAPHHRHQVCEWHHHHRVCFWR